MSDKKIDDIESRPRDGYGNEKDAFIPPRERRPASNFSMANIDNSPGLSILAYCLSSISMTVVNKYVVSGDSWNLNLFYLAVQVSCQRLVTDLWQDQCDHTLTCAIQGYRLHFSDHHLQKCWLNQEPSPLRLRQG